MKKIAILALAFYMSFGHLAYASARLECASMMNPISSSASSKMSAHHACCDAVPCQCSIKAPTNDSLVPAQASVELAKEICLPNTAVFEFLPQSFAASSFAPFKSPPRPLHGYSILRI